MNQPKIIIEVSNTLNKVEINLVERFILNMTDGGYSEIYNAKEYADSSYFAEKIAEKINQENADSVE